MEMHLLRGRYSYSKKNLLGHGSFGEVYFGRDEKTKAKVAIKTIHSQFIQNE